MSLINKAMIQDGNNARPDQFFNEVTQEFILVSAINPYPIRVYPKHKGFIASQGTWGWYTLQTANEVIIFDHVLNSIMVNSKDDGLKIKINENSDFWFIDAFSSEGVEDIAISKIQIIMPVGTLIKFRGLYI